MDTFDQIKQIFFVMSYLLIQILLVIQTIE